MPRYAMPTAVATAQRRHGELVSDTDAEVPGHDPHLLGRLVALPADRVPWDGPAAEVIAHDGHAPGHGAVFLPDTGVLVAGDMLSDVEIPLLDVTGADPLGDYRPGLERLAALEGCAARCRGTVRWAMRGSSGAGWRPTSGIWSSSRASRSRTRAVTRTGCGRSTRRSAASELADRLAPMLLPPASGRRAAGAEGAACVVGQRDRDQADLERRGRRPAGPGA